MIDVDEGEVVELLQHEMRRVVVDGAALVPAEPLQEHLEGRAVEHVLARMNFVADVDTVLVIDVEDRLPSLRQLAESLLDQARRPLRPGIEIGEGKRAGERHRDVEAEIARGLRRRLHLPDGPGLTRGRVAVHFLRGEGIELAVIGGMHRDELTL